MGVRFLVAASLCWSAVAAAQMSGQFYLEKKTYALGEPVLVYFKVINDGPNAEIFYRGDPYSLHPLCSAYQFSVSGEWPIEPSNPSCRPGINRGLSVGCGDFKTILQPGETHIDRVVLNLSRKVGSPGRYTVEATYGALFPEASKDLREVHSTLVFEIDHKPVDPKVFQFWVDQLYSTDPMKRSEAARVLASVAPRSLEDLLLTFADDPLIQQYAPLALHRLNTPRSIAALKALADNPKSEPWLQKRAATYLANDPCAPGDP